MTRPRVSLESIDEISFIVIGLQLFLFNMILFSVDTSLPISLEGLLQNGLACLFSLGFICAIFPWYIIVLVFLGFLFYYIGKIFRQECSTTKFSIIGTIFVLTISFVFEQSCLARLEALWEQHTIASAELRYGFHKRPGHDSRVWERERFRSTVSSIFSQTDICTVKKML